MLCTVVISTFWSTYFSFTIILVLTLHQLTVMVLHLTFILMRCIFVCKFCTFVVTCRPTRVIWAERCAWSTWQWETWTAWNKR